MAVYQARGDRQSPHHEHLARALDRLRYPALVTRGKPCVFSWQEPALFGHELLQQVRILVVDGAQYEIHLRLRTRGSRNGIATLAFFVGMSFARHGAYLISR
jgi:hypothetical protein